MEPTVVTEAVDKVVTKNRLDWVSKNQSLALIILLLGCNMWLVFYIIGHLEKQVQDERDLNARKDVLLENYQKGDQRIREIQELGQRTVPYNTKP